MQRWMLTLMWVAATALMTFVTFQAVSLVGSTVTNRPTSGTAAAPDTPDSSAPTSDSSSTTIPTPTSIDRSSRIDDATSSSTSGSTSTTSTSTPGSSSTTPSGSSTSSTSTSSTSPGSTSSTSSTSTTSTTTPAAVTGPFRFSSEGGLVTVSCQGDRIIFQGASPNPGYTIDVKSQGPGKVDVEFESGDDEDRVVVECDDGVAEAD